MTSDALNWISKISSRLGLWMTLGIIMSIITSIILCWKRIFYVRGLRNARKKALGRIQSLRNEIQSLIDTHPNIDGVICQVLHNNIQDRLERLDTLSWVEDSAWINFSALFRADPCLRLLEGLAQDLMHKVQRMTEAREIRLLIQEAHRPSDISLNLFSRPAPLGGTVNPPDFEHSRIYRETGAHYPVADYGPSTAEHVLPDTSACIEEQNDANPAGVARTRFSSFSPSASRRSSHENFLSGYKGISIDEGVSPSISNQNAWDIGDTSSPPPKQRISQSLVLPDVSNASHHRSSFTPPASSVDLISLFHARLQATEQEVEKLNFILDFVSWASRSDFLYLQQPEPIVGSPISNYPVGMQDFGIKGQSVYTALFHHYDMATFACKLCSHMVEDDLEAAICHQRTEHFSHYPYRCTATHTQCGQRFASQAQLEEHQFDTSHWYQRIEGLHNYRTGNLIGNCVWVLRTALKPLKLGHRVA